MNRIAEELVRIAKQLLADSDYIYDPEHKKKPSGGYHKTEKGWSKLEQKKEKPVKPVNKTVNVEEHDSRIKQLNEYDQRKQKEFDLDKGLMLKRLIQPSNPATWQNRLEKLSQSRDWQVRQCVAGNPSTPEEALDKLSNDQYWRVRATVAQNPYASDETVEKLSNDTNEWVRSQVARTTMSTKILNKLSKDSEWVVRNEVALNRNTPTDLLDKLSEDENNRIVESVIRNPNTSPTTLKKLTKHKNKQIRGEASGWLDYRTQKSNSNGIDFSKMTPELRQKIKDWDVEDIKKFLNWLHKNGYKGVIPTEEEQI